MGGNFYRITLPHLTVIFNLEAHRSECHVPLAYRKIVNIQSLPNPTFTISNRFDIVPTNERYKTRMYVSVGSLCPDRSVVVKRLDYSLLLGQNSLILESAGAHVHECKLTDFIPKLVNGKLEKPSESPDLSTYLPRLTAVKLQEASSPSQDMCRILDYTCLIHNMLTFPTELGKPLRIWEVPVDMKIPLGRWLIAEYVHNEFVYRDCDQ